MTAVDVLGFALGADACGAAGCQETDVLYHVETPRGDRVLCPAHVLAFPHQLRRDGGGDPGRSRSGSVRQSRSFKTDARDARCRNARLHERSRLRRDEATPALTRANGIRRGLPVPSRWAGKNVALRSAKGVRRRSADVDAARRVVAANQTTRMQTDRRDSGAVQLPDPRRRPSVSDGVQGVSTPGGQQYRRSYSRVAEVERVCPPPTPPGLWGVWHTPPSPPHTHGATVRGGCA